jgi:hypothetical protein
VCYFGETVDEYEDGEPTGHGGEWLAGEDDAAPGIIMPGTPRAGTMFYQENAPGVAQDKSAVAALDETVTVPAGTFDAIRLIDWNPLEGESLAHGETKYYVEGIGNVVDEAAELIDYTE